MESKTITNRCDHKNEFVFSMIWSNDTPCRQLSVYKKDDVILAVNKAYRDMMQHNMNGFGLKKVYKFKCKTDINKSQTRKNILTKKNKIVKDLKEEIAENFVKIFEEGKFDNDVHLNLCKNFLTSFKSKLEDLNKDIKALMPDTPDAQVDIEQLKFGLAQKIINMSFKYLYLFDIKENNTSDNEHNIFENCHMPIDSYILKYLNNEGKIKEITVENTVYKLNKLKWSQLDEDQYKELRESIKKYCENTYQDDRKFPFFAEFYIWPTALKKYAEKNPYKSE